MEELGGELLYIFASDGIHTGVLLGVVGGRKAEKDIERCKISS